MVLSIDHSLHHLISGCGPKLPLFYIPNFISQVNEKELLALISSAPGNTLTHSLQSDVVLLMWCW